jgi:hypothetical protein
MMHNTLVVLHAWPFWLITLGGEASAENKVTTVPSLSCAEMNIPSTTFGIKLSPSHTGTKDTVLAEVELFVHIVKVSPQLGPRRESFGPCPILV